jgi:Pyruvate/2-oxoacid:ferredoxin oxidoreductase gamma subunit
MMGGLARVLGMPSMEAISKAIQKEVPSKPNANIKAAEMAYEQVQLLRPLGEVKVSNP